MTERKKIIVAIIVFVVTFLVFRELFSNWDYFKEMLYQFDFVMSLN
ncbi:hypothetical protein [Lutibacter sp.]